MEGFFESLKPQGQQTLQFSPMRVVRLRNARLDRFLKVGACGVVLGVEAFLLHPFPETLNQIEVGRVSR
jgi:hypothetical protein